MVYLRMKLMERNNDCTDELQNLSAKVVLHAKARVKGYMVVQKLNNSVILD